MALSDLSWKHVTAFIETVKPDSFFLTKALLGNIDNAPVEPVPYIEFEYEYAPRRLAPLRTYLDEPVNISVEFKRKVRRIDMPSIPLVDNVRVIEGLYPVTYEDQGSSNITIAKENRILNERIQKKLKAMKDMISRRIEYMIADIMADGVLSYSDTESGTSFTFDFELDDSMFYTADTLWTDVSSADPVKDLDKARRFFSKMSGYAPDLIIMGEDAYDAILSSDKLLKKLDVRRLEIGNMQPAKLMDDYGTVQFVMRLLGIGDIYVYTGTYEDESGTEQLYLPKDSVFMTNSKFWELHYGAIYNTKAGGIVAKRFFSYVEPKGRSYELYVESNPMVVVTRNTAVLKMKVV